MQDSGYHRTMNRFLQELESKAKRAVRKDLGAEFKLVSGAQEAMPVNVELSQTQLLMDRQSVPGSRIVIRT